MADTKFKVGDRVVAKASCHWGSVKEGYLGTVIPNSPGYNGTLVEFDNYCGGHDGARAGKHGHCFWLCDSEIELVHEAPIPEAAPITVNVTINLYENACWYCRKGGLVDRIFNGTLGICPCCGRLCNDTRKTTESVKTVKSEKKDNKPLTGEELEALPDGTKVFVVFNKCENGKYLDEPNWDSKYTCWRTKEGYSLKWSGGYVRIKDDAAAYRAYLEEPERPNPEPELPF